MTPKKYPKPRVMHDFTQELPVKLTDVELLERGNDLAMIDSLIRDEDAHAEAVKKDLKTRLANLEARRANLARVVRDKSEPRPIRCEGIARFDEGIYEAIRTDSGEVVPGTRRRLNELELQGTFDLEDEP